LSKLPSYAVKNFERDPSKYKDIENYPSCDFVPETIGFIEVLHFRNVPKNLPFRLQIERLCTVVYCIVMLSSVILFYNKEFWGGK